MPVLGLWWAFSAAHLQLVGGGRQSVQHPSSWSVEELRSEGARGRKKREREREINIRIIPFTAISRLAKSHRQHVTPNCSLETLVPPVVLKKNKKCIWDQPGLGRPKPWLRKTDAQNDILERFATSPGSKRHLFFQMAHWTSLWPQSSLKRISKAIAPNQASGDLNHGCKKTCLE